MRIVMLGPPGSGKGTQAAKLSSHFAIPHIATGDMLRRAVAARTELGRKAEEYMRRGDLVPDDLVIAMTLERLGEEDCRNGFILDGFPRTVPQAKALEEKVNLDAVVNIAVDRDEIVKRFAGRRVCTDCEAVYHIVSNPPKVDGVCDVCGGKLVQREDDREEVVRERFRTYEEKTKPLVEYYRERSLLVTVDGAGGIEETFSLILNALEV